eukprot:gene20026-39071_t
MGGGWWCGMVGRGATGGVERAAPLPDIRTGGGAVRGERAGRVFRCETFFPRFLDSHLRNDTAGSGVVAIGGKALTTGAPRPVGVGTTHGEE